MGSSLRPHEGLAGCWPSQSGKWADMVNAMPKWVGSSTLSEDLEWNATLLDANLEESIPRLKVSAAVALANIAALEAEDVLGHVRRNEALFERTLRGLLDIPIVGDVRGAGYFWAIELVRDRATKESFDAEARERLLRGFLSPELFRRGLICRTDDRGEPVIQLAPPLIAGPQEFEQIAAVLRPVLEAAADRMAA